jgi:high affinity Mn2+ porin
MILRIGLLLCALPAFMLPPAAVDAATTGPTTQSAASEGSASAKRAALIERRNALRDALKATEAELNEIPGDSATHPSRTLPEQATSLTPARVPETNTPANPTDTPAGSVPGAPDTERFKVHGQTTVITQWHDIFPAPYSGPLSLKTHESSKTSVTATLFMGMQLPWRGGAFYFDPEITGGAGFSGVAGIASFPNGEIARVGSAEPEPYVARAYYQQIFELGAEKEKVESGQNQLAGERAARRITVWLGKFAATDFFDNNAYSHDPRTQFMNWSLMDDTAWDYPADTRGYTAGGVIEYNEPLWAIRYGAMAEPRNANGATLDPHISQALGNALEFEDRWSIGKQPGVARLLGFVNLAHMGNYRQAIDSPGPNGPDITTARSYSAKYGVSLSAEQAITPDLGIWGRAGWNDGHTESWAFAEVERLASLGISIKGAGWGRPDDVFGFAGAIAGLARDHRNYLEAGGEGFIIGDGRLNYATEQIIETYYQIKVAEHLFFTPDFQFVNHPAYNSDRGPVFIVGARAHVEF